MHMAICPSESAVESISVDCNVQGNCVCEKDTSKKNSWLLELNFRWSALILLFSDYQCHWCHVSVEPCGHETQPLLQHVLGYTKAARCDGSVHRLKLCVQQSLLNCDPADNFCNSTLSNGAIQLRVLLTHGEVFSHIFTKNCVKWFKSAWMG